ncbi:MAG: LysR family transcriptional regulator [Polyangiaceae bacterium]
MALTRVSTIPELRLADLHTLLAVQRTGAISGAARELRVTPSQVSKAMVRLERHFGVRLLARGPRGVTPTAAGRKVLPHVVSAVEELRATAGIREEKAKGFELTLAGPSYLIAGILPALSALVPQARLRALEFGPARLRASLAENLFDVALSPGGVDARPSAWTSDDIGMIRIVLLGSPSLAARIGPLPLTVDAVRALSFIGPAKADAGCPVTTDDDCPLTLAERRIAHEAQTIGAALEIASATDHVVFGPLPAARRYIEQGALVELPVAGWDVRESLHVLCNGDRVLARVRNAILQATQRVVS